MFDIIRKNPRTTLAGIAGSLSLFAGMLGTYQGGKWWPVLLGIVLKGACDALAHALAADAKGEEIVR